MSKDKQRLQEQFHFNLFKRLCDQWRDGEEYHKDEQKPDFIITYPDKTLGIEHTEIFMDKVRGQTVSPQQREGSLWRIVEDARIICKNEQIPPLEVKVWFSNEFEDTRIIHKKAKLLSKQLAKFVKKESDKGLSPLTHIDEPGDRIPGISQITIDPGILNSHMWLTYHRWTKCAAGKRQTDFIAELQKCIDDKNKKYKEKYITNCSECWLLIVADRSNPAQNFDIDFSSKVAEHAYQSKFSKTFYLEVTHKRLVELK